MDRAIIGLSGLGDSFIPSTMFLMGLNVLWEKDDAGTCQLVFIFFGLGSIFDNK